MLRRTLAAGMAILALLTGAAHSLPADRPAQTPSDPPAHKATRPQKLESPPIRFRGVSPSTPGPGYLRLIFEVSNPNAEPIRYFGFRADSFDPPLRQGQIAPWEVRAFRCQGKWEEHQEMLCGGWGFGKMVLPPKETRWFTVDVPKTGWQELKVGLDRWWVTGPGRKTEGGWAWSAPVTAQEVAKRVKR